MQWHTLTVESANAIIAKNKAQEPVSGLEAYSLTAEENTRLPHFENVVGQDSLNRFDRPKKRKPQHRKRKNTRNAKRKKTLRRCYLQPFFFSSVVVVLLPQQTIAPIRALTQLWPNNSPAEFTLVNLGGQLRCVYPPPK